MSRLCALGWDNWGVITWKVAAAWVAALVITTVLTWQIVGLADSQVGDTPVAVAPAPTSTTPSTTSTTVATTTTSVPTTTSTSSQTTTTATTGSGSSPTTTATTIPAQTTAAVDWTVRTINSQGGTVVVRHRPGEVELQAATPAAGFSVEIDDRGPERVRVEFEGEEDDFGVEVEWEDGNLDVSVDD